MECDIKNESIIYEKSFLSNRRNKIKHTVKRVFFKKKGLNKEKEHKSFNYYYGVIKCWVFIGREYNNY